MTPEQTYAEVQRRWEEVQEELLHLARSESELEPEDYDRRRTQLLTLREALEDQLAELSEDGPPLES